MRKVIPGILTAALCFVVLATLFGDSIKSMNGMSADALAGDTVVEKRVTGRLERKTLQNFGEDNSGYDTPSAATPTPYVAPTLVANPVTETRRDALSTFAIDVDTASWTYSRRLVVDRRTLPSAQDIRVEEWVNAFEYDLAKPRGETPVAVSIQGATSPFDEAKTLVKVSLKAREVETRMPANLVFLVDTSGSMDSPDRLPLAKFALHELVKNLNEKDTVAIVTYAGSTELRLAPTSAAKKTAIDRAIDTLASGGGTSMGSGMELAYQLAVQQVNSKTTTRVIVLTDGDTNIGPNLTPDQMLAAVNAHVAEGVTLTTVGFGTGNYRGDALERLADKGNGQALYFADTHDVVKSFGKQLTGTLEVVAKDVKVQVSFNADVVSSYRLLGYENRAVADADFRNDRVDAGELGAGHAVTALYEVTLTSKAGSLGSVAIRGQANGRVFELEQAIERAAVSHAVSEQNADFRFATAVALGADTLRGNAVGSWSLRAIAELASNAVDGREDRREFVDFLQRAEALRSRPVAVGY